MTMPYLRQPLGGIIDELATAASIATDPYLPEVSCRVRQLQAIKAGQAQGDCPKTAPRQGGVLENLVVPLRGYVYAQSHTWVYPLAALAILGLPLWLGYQMGKNRS